MEEHKREISLRLAESGRLPSDTTSRLECSSFDCGNENVGVPSNVLSDDRWNPVPAIVVAELKSYGDCSSMSVEDALDFGYRTESPWHKTTAVPNLFTFDASAGTFKLEFYENERAYIQGQGPSGPRKIEPSKSVRKVQAELSIAPNRVNTPAARKFTIVANYTPRTSFGINWAASIIFTPHVRTVRRSFMIHLPGERTYDPAGMSNDPHQSERVGGSCAKTQLMITIAELHALKYGARLEQVKTHIQDKFEPIIERYHGRETMFRYMWHQIEQTWQYKTPLSYPAFVSREVSLGMLKVNIPERMHTRKFLASYLAGNPRPPNEYFRKLVDSHKPNLGQKMTGYVEDLAMRRPAEKAQDSFFQAVWRRDLHRMDEYIKDGAIDKYASYKCKVPIRKRTASVEVPDEMKVLDSFERCTALHVAIRGLVRQVSTYDERIFYQYVQVVLHLLDANIHIRPDNDGKYASEMIVQLLDKHYEALSYRSRQRCLSSFHRYSSFLFVACSRPRHNRRRLGFRQFVTLAKLLVIVSVNPVLGALRTAAHFQLLANLHAEMTQVSAGLENIAARLVCLPLQPRDYVDKRELRALSAAFGPGRNALCAWQLFRSGGTSVTDCALAEAFQNHQIDFVATKAVQSVVETIWLGNHYSNVRAEIIAATLADCKRDDSRAEDDTLVTDSSTTTARFLNPTVLSNSIRDSEILKLFWRYPIVIFSVEATVDLLLVVLYTYFIFGLSETYPLLWIMLLCRLARIVEDTLLVNSISIYLADTRHRLNLGTLVTEFATLVSFRKSRQDEGQFKMWAAILIILLHAQVLFYMLAIRKLGVHIKTIQAFFEDVAWFLLIAGVLIVASGLALHTLFHDERRRVENHSHHWAFRSLVASPASAIFSSFQTFVGDFEFGVFDIGADTGLPARWARKALYAASVVTMHVILLNLLIAIMTSTFSRINSNIIRRGLYERARIIYYYSCGNQLPFPLNMLSLFNRAFQRIVSEGGLPAMSSKHPQNPTMCDPNFAAERPLPGIQASGLEKSVGQAEACENLSYNINLIRNVVFAPEIEHVRQQHYGGRAMDVSCDELIEAIMSCPDALYLLAPPRSCLESPIHESTVIKAEWPTVQ